MKTEMLQDGSFIGSSDARTEIFEYMEACDNKHRKHSSLGCLNLAQFEAPIHSLN